MLKLTNTGFFYIWIEKEDGGNWVLTNKGFQVYDVGQYTYLIYNGTKLENQISCGLRHIEVNLDPLLDVDDSADNSYFLLPGESRIFNSGIPNAAGKPTHIGALGPPNLNQIYIPPASLFGSPVSGAF